MKKHICLLGLISLLLTLNISRLYAQNADVGIGQWRVHLPYNIGKSLAETGKIVYCASVSGLFSYTKADGSVKRISRVSGLSDFQIQAIRYDAALGVLIIAYQDANIDLLYDNGSIVNLSDIKRQNLSGNITINNIYFKDHFAYLACGFGIVILDLDRQEVYDTYYIGPNGTNINVNDITADSTYFYAATDSGIYKALINDPLIYLYSEWSTDQTLPNPNSRYGSICLFNNKIYCVNNDSIVLQHDSSVWSYFPFPRYYSTKVSAYGNYLMIRNFFSVSGYDVNGNRAYYSDQGSYPHASPQEALVDANNVMYIADANNGLVKDQQGNYSIIYPNGPSNTVSVAMASEGDDIWVATGSISSLTACTPLYTRNGIYHYSNNNWNSFYNLNTPLFDTLNFPDVMDIKCDPNDSKHAFVAGFGGGVLEFRDTGFVGRYDSTNSTLRGLSGSYNPMLIAGLNFDQNNNLWVLNSGVSNPLSVRLTDGTWYSFNLPATVASSCLGSILVDDNNYKWFIINGTGIGVFYENDILNKSDDQFKILTTGTGYGNLPTSQILSMAIDQDGTIWIGSEDGVAAFYSSQSVFDPTGFDAQQVLIQQGPYTQILLQDQNVTAIAVDGANQKWFGTDNGGVFYTSADGTNQILNFNTSNSPLLSNNITSIAVDQATGEVFFGTDQGICSYRGSATEGGDACDSYYVFPNPVKHDYNGLIAVRGLVANAHVKITDIGGSVVYETTANGGQATWSGNNYQGQRAHTGVYLVFVSNDDGSATCVTKFLMLN